MARLTTRFPVGKIVIDRSTSRKCMVKSRQQNQLIMQVIYDPTGLLPARVDNFCSVHITLADRILYPIPDFSPSCATYETLIQRLKERTLPPLAFDY